MAANHIYFDDATKYGGMLRRLLNLIETGDDLFVDVRDVMIQMRDGDGSQASHYAEVVKRFGFGGYDSTQGDPDAAQLALAKAAFDELDSAYSKTSGNVLRVANASVTDVGGGFSDVTTSVRAARDQLLAKLR